MNQSLRVLEGLGYCSAVLIAVGTLGNNPVLKFFHVMGIVIGLVVLVRLLTIQAAEKQPGKPAELEPVDQEHQDAKQAEAKEEVTR